MQQTGFLTIFATYDAFEMVKQTLPSVIEECERAGSALIVHDSTEKNRGELWAWLQELSERHKFFLILSSNLSMAHARNLCLRLGMEMYAPQYIALMEDDHGFRQGLITEMTEAMREYYGKPAPNGLRYGLFTGCRKCWGEHPFHPTGNGHAYPDENLPPLLLGGSASCFRCAPTSHWATVLKGYDIDEYPMSEHQTSLCSLRNYHHGFTTLVVRNGDLMFSVGRTGRGVTRPASEWLFDPRYTASDRRSRYLGKPLSIASTDADVLEQPPKGASVSNFSVLEHGGDGTRWRWALGPESTVVIDSVAEEVTIGFAFDSPIAQTVTVVWNGQVLDVVNAVPGESYPRSLRATAVEGSNWLVFRYSDWNGRESLFAPGDSRTIAVRFTELQAAACVPEEAPPNAAGPQ